MAVSKVILDGTTLIDLTDDTVVAGKVVTGYKATGADGVEFTGTIATKASSDMTQSNLTITAPAGYYSANGVKTITSANVPKDTAFTVTATADTALDTTSDITVSNAAYRKLAITNAANGTAAITNNGTIASLTNAGTITAITNNASKTITNITNSGTAKVTSGSATAGTLTVSAYNASGTAENDKSIVSAGKWVATSVSATGTFYGRVTVSAGSVTPSFANTNISTYFNSGTSSSNSISITPNYTSSAGFITTNSSAVSGTASYYTIKTASPTFSAAPTGGSTATGTNCTLGSTDNGIKVQTKYSINAVNINYAAAATGWISKAANADTGSDTTAKSSTNGTAYYISGVTLAAPASGNRTFEITVPDASTFAVTVDSNGNTVWTEI